MFLDRASGAPGRYTRPVAVRIFQSALPPRKTLFVDGDATLLRDGVDVIDVKVDERVRPRVTRMFGEIRAGTSSRHRNKPRQARLELMLPLLAEAEPLVPGNSPRRILDVKNGHDLLVHSVEVTAARGTAAWAE